VSERTDSQIIHEAMGLCWHTVDINHIQLNGWVYSCSCGGKSDRPTPHKEDALAFKRTHEVSNPPYTNAFFYLEAMAWAKEQDWFADFIGRYIYWKTDASSTVCDIDKLVDTLLDSKLGSYALASYMKEKCNCERPRRPEEIIRPHCFIHPHAWKEGRER